MNIFKLYDRNDDILFRLRFALLTVVVGVLTLGARGQRFQPQQLTPEQLAFVLQQAQQQNFFPQQSFQQQQFQQQPPFQQFPQQQILREQQNQFEQQQSQFQSRPQLVFQNEDAIRQQQTQFLLQQFGGHQAQSLGPSVSGLSLIDELANNKTLGALSDDNIRAIIADEESVNILTACFVNPNTCQSEATRNIISK